MPNESFMIAAEELDCDDLLSEWSWLLDRPYQPVGMSPFGDWFLLDDDGVVYFLELSVGRVFALANSMEEFEAGMSLPENEERWFAASLVRELREKGVVPGSGECYGYKEPPAEGGRSVAENVEVVDLGIYQAKMGQLQRELSRA